MAKFKVGEIVRVRGEPKGSINEFARVDQIFDKNTVWLSNINQPFSGSMCGAYDLQLIEKANF